MIGRFCTGIEIILKKKPDFLPPRQPGYLLRPLAFRPCLPAGLALSYIFFLTELYVMRRALVKGAMLYVESFRQT
jgi:hypothetical protein